MSSKTQIPGFLWDEKGKIDTLRVAAVCCVYYLKESSGRMSHTGLYLPPVPPEAEGTVIHAQGHATGVIKETLDDFPWTHYAWKEMTEEQEATIRAWALARVGNPYIYGAYERECTPAFRKNRAAAYPDYKANIYKYCPVLSGKQATCSGCKYVNLLAYDCAQFTRYGYDAAGLYLPSGANNQYYEWIPDNAPGIDGAVAYASDLPDTLRRGNEGTDVKTLQELLNDNGAALKVDGIFGRLTRDAVIAYQQTNGLGVDGVVGRQTWTALLKPEETDADETVDEADEPEEDNTDVADPVYAWLITATEARMEELLDENKDLIAVKQA